MVANLRKELSGPLIILSMPDSTRISLNTLADVFNSAEELRDLTLDFLVIVSFFLDCIQIHELICFARWSLSI